MMVRGEIVNLHHRTKDEYDKHDKPEGIAGG
jgi:hypothetical protein